MKDFVRSKLENHYMSQTTTPISFRGYQDTIDDADILAKLLGYSTRSKLLSDLVPTALKQAIDALPEDLYKEYYKSRFGRDLESTPSE